MNPIERRIWPLLGSLISTLVLTEILWTQKGSFFGLAVAALLGVLSASWSLKFTEAHWPIPPIEPMRPFEKFKPPSPLGFMALLAGFALLGLALWLALNDFLASSFAAATAASLCWWPMVDLRAEPGLPKKWLAILMFAAMFSGAVFRFYKAGDVPAGMLTVDEPRLMVEANEVLDGTRMTFYITYKGTEGEAPWWIEAAAMKLFGRDITGFRMSALIPGLILVGLIGVLGLELAGSRTGLLAAGLAAVCVWPVTFSRTEYIIGSSLLAPVAALWLLLSGLRRGRVFHLVLCGFCVGLSFNVYTPARLLTAPLLGLLAFYVCLGRPAWRASLRRAGLPLFSGLLVGLAPLLLWAASNPTAAFQAYFGKLTTPMIVGDGVAQMPGFLSKVNLLLGNILPGLPQLFTMFTTHGGMRPWFFKLDQPVVSHTVLFLMLCGLAICMIRFRQPSYAFIVTWWLMGLTPTLLAAPQFHMDERRIMMAMPATLLLAAVGLHGAMDVCTRHMRKRAGDGVMLALALVFFCGLGTQSWRTYFHDIQEDRGHQDYNHDNFDNMVRAIFIANKVSPVTVISFRKPNNNGWWGSNPLNELEDHWNVLGHIPRQIACAYTAADYLKKGGLFGALRNLGNTYGRDPLIVLTPFHYYLEPLLEGQLGGVRVADIPPVMATDGINYMDVGMAWDPRSATRLIRLRNFQPERLEMLETRWLFPYTAAKLFPPASIGTRDYLAGLFILDRGHIDALKAYDHNPAAWRAENPVRFSVADPYFWVTAGNLPGDLRPPLRLSARWILRIPVTGLYSLGASTTGYLAISVDGKRAFTYLPTERAQQDQGRQGYLGKPVLLTAGDHRLSMDQVFLSSNGNFDELIRLIWKKPQGTVETLPLENLLPGMRTFTKSLSTE